MIEDPTIEALLVRMKLAGLNVENNPSYRSFLYGYELVKPLKKAYPKYEAYLRDHAQKALDEEYI